MRLEPSKSTCWIDGSGEGGGCDIYPVDGTTMLPLLLKSNNLKESDINMIDMPVASMVPALLQGQVDAVLGSIDAYQIQAESQGAQLDVYRFADYGVPTVSTSIFASNAVGGDA